MFIVRTSGTQSLYFFFSRVMTTEHYDPPTADELAAYEECRRRPDMVDKDMEMYAELGSLAKKMRGTLFSEIWEMESELKTARHEVVVLEDEIGHRRKVISSLYRFLCEDRFETEEEEEE